MKASVPSRCRSEVSPAATSGPLAMPKSITRGPVVLSSTLSGFRSRCTTPAAAMLASADATPTAKPSSTGTGRGPPVSTASRRLGPSMNSVTT